MKAYCIVHLFILSYNSSVKSYPPHPAPPPHLEGDIPHPMGGGAHTCGGQWSIKIYFCLAYISIACSSQPISGLSVDLVVIRRSASVHNLVTEINCFGILFVTSTAPRDKILIKFTKLSCSPWTLVFNCQGLCTVYFTLNRQVGRCFHPGCPLSWLKRNLFSSKSPARTDD